MNEIIHSIFFNTKEKERVYTKIFDLIYSNDAKTLEDAFNNIVQYLDLDSLSKEKQEIIFAIIRVFLSIVAEK